VYAIDILDTIIPHFRHDIPVVEEGLEEKIRAYSQRIYSAPPRDGFIVFVQYAHNRGKRICIHSDAFSRDHITELADVWGIADCVDDIGGKELEVPPDSTKIGDPTYFYGPIYALQSQNRQHIFIMAKNFAYFTRSGVCALDDIVNIDDIGRRQTFINGVSIDLLRNISK